MKKFLPTERSEPLQSWRDFGEWKHVTQTPLLSSRFSDRAPSEAPTITNETPLPTSMQIKVQAPETSCWKQTTPPSISHARITVLRRARRWMCRESVCITMSKPREVPMYLFSWIYKYIAWSTTRMVLSRPVFPPQTTSKNIHPIVYSFNSLSQLNHPIVL